MDIQLICDIQAEMHESFRLNSDSKHIMVQCSVTWFRTPIYYVHHLGTEGFSHTPGSHSVLFEPGFAMCSYKLWKVVSLQGSLSTRQCGNYLTSLPVLHYSLQTGKEARPTLFNDISFSSFTDFPLLLQFQEGPGQTACDFVWLLLIKV